MIQMNSIRSKRHSSHGQISEVHRLNIARFALVEQEK